MMISRQLKKLNNISLFPDQIEEVKKTIDAIQRGKNPLVQSPAGSGKSYQMMSLANWELKRGGTVMYMAQSKVIISQIQNKFSENNVQVDVKSKQSLAYKDNLTKLDYEPTMIITDETHHSEAEGYKKTYKQFPNAIRVGYTATPWRLDHKGFTETYDVLIMGTTVKELISKSRLSDFVMYGYDIGNSNVLKANSTHDITYQVIHDYFKESKKRVIFGKIVPTWEANARGLKTIVYCYSVPFAKKVSGLFNDAGYKADFVSSKMSDKERNNVMNKFKNDEISILCNYGIVGEGYDLPDCSCVVLLRPTVSLTVYLQQSMRCMRYKPNKRAVIIDMVGNFMRFGLPSTEYDYSLDSSERFRIKGKTPVKACKQCGIVVPTQTTVCPNCGYEFPIKKKHDAIYDLQLQRIKEHPELKPWIGKSAKDAKSIEDLVKIEDVNFKSEGWAFKQGIKTGFLNKENFPEIGDYY